MPHDPQSLREFATSILSDLTSGRISVYEALSAASQYSCLREAIQANKDALSQAELVGENELIAAIEATISQAAERLSELPNFQNQQPDRILEEKEVRDLGELRKYAATRIKQATAAKLSSQQGKRRAFVHTLVDRFSSTLPTVSEERLAPVIDGALIAASAEATGKQTKERFAELLIASQEISGAALTQQQTNQLKSDVRAALTENDAYVSGATEQVKRGRVLESALFDYADMRRPDVFVDVVLNAPETESFSDSMTRAEKLSQIAQSLEAQKGQKGGGLQFFSASGTKGVAKGLQQGADGILSLVGEPLRDIVLHEKVNGTLRSMLTSSQRFTDRLGENFVRSSLFAHISQDLTRQLSEKPSMGQARTVFDDVFSSVFRGPMDPVLMRGTQERLLDYFELARANASTPKKFLPAGVMPWDLFRTRNPDAGRSSTRRPAWLPWIGLGSFGGVLGRLLEGVVDRTTSFLFANPFIPRQLAGSRRAATIPLPLKDDMPLMVALVVVIVLILLFILPTPLNLSQLSHSSKVSALLATLQNKYGTPGGGEFPIGTIGEATLTCANISGAHKYQNDPSWSAVNCQNTRPDIPACRPPTECTIGLSGCGSTSAAIILNSFGSNTSVPTVWNVQHQAGGYAYYNRSCASYWSGPINILREANLSVFQIGIAEAPRVLKDCGLLLAFVDEKWSNGSPTGHIIVITGISQEGNTIKVTTLDPMRPPGYVSTVTSNPSKSGDINIRGLFAVVK